MSREKLGLAEAMGMVTAKEHRMEAVARIAEALDLQMRRAETAEELMPYLQSDIPEARQIALRALEGVRRE